MMKITALKSFALVVSSMILVGCGPAAMTSTEGTDAPREAKSGDPYPTFSEGGTLTLSFNGQAATLKVDSVYLANTDSGYPDYLEIEGPGTYVCALIDPKMPDEEGEGYYKPIVGRALPLNVPKDLLPNEREITAPNVGKYTVVDGNLTMGKFQNGMDGRDHWDGKIDLQLQTTQGVIPVSGTFSFTVVPTW